MAALLRAILGYFVLIGAVRLSARRPGKQITPFEFVLVFFIGGLALTAMVGDDPSFTNAACSILGIGLAHVAVSWIRWKWPRAARLLDGTPLVLLEGGQWRETVMQKMRVHDDDVMAAARDHGITTIHGVKAAIIERNGEITIPRGS
jgi:uncharacterized membrane protein YcaP (DUF421 family)